MTPQPNEDTTVDDVELNKLWALFMNEPQFLYKFQSDVMPHRLMRIVSQHYARKQLEQEIKQLEFAKEAVWIADSFQEAIDEIQDRLDTLNKEARG